MTITRRSLFGALAAAPLAIPALAAEAGSPIEPMFHSTGDARVRAAHLLEGYPALLDHVSTDPNEAGYVDWRFAMRDRKRVIVKVDGVDVSYRCEAADAAKGWARCYVPGPDGGPFLDETKTNVVKENLRGLVTISVI